MKQRIDLTEEFLIAIAECIPFACNGGYAQVSTGVTLPDGKVTRVRLVVVPEVIEPSPKPPEKPKTKLEVVK